MLNDSTLLTGNARCSIQNVYHYNCGGCFLTKNSNGETLHQFKGVQVALCPDGKPLLFKLGMGNLQTICFPNGNNQKCSVLTNLGAATFECLEKYVRTGYDVIYLINAVSKLTVILQEKTTDTQKIWYPSGESLFDVVYLLVSEIPKIVLLRPVNFHTSFKNFLFDLQSAIPNLFEMATNNNIDALRLKQRGQNAGQNQKSCSPKYFVDNKVSLLTCLDQNNSPCIHEKYFKQNKRALLARQLEMPCCRRLWSKMIENARGSAASKMTEKLEDYVEFRCIHQQTHNYRTLMQNTFNRTTKIHTIFCFPKQLLGFSWYVEYYRLISDAIEEHSKLVEFPDEIEINNQLKHFSTQIVQ